MSIDRLDPANWEHYFNAVSKLLPGMQAEIEVNSLDIGAQLEADFAPLLGIVYDRKSAILEVIIEGLDHTIPNVKEIWVDHDGVRLNSVNVVDAGGTQQVIRLREPVMLPAPAKQP